MPDGLGTQQTNGLARHRLIGLFGGPALALAMVLAPPPAGLSADGWTVAAVGALMAVWWMTEALPLAATALLPLALFPLLGARDLALTATSYAHPLIFLFLGGFLLARAVQVWGVDRRLAYAVLRRTGTNPPAVIAGIMAVTAFLSMWVSNTATAMVMLPIGQSIITASAAPATDERDDFAAALMLAIAYAATIGGMGTLIGTPPNALFAGFMATTYGIEIGFAQWMLVGVPLVLILLPITWLVLVRLVFRIPGNRTAPRPANAHTHLGPWSRGEGIVGTVMALAAVGWLSRPLLTEALPGIALSDANIAIVCAIALFILPVDLKRGRFALSWQDAAQIRWDVLILFGGGLALAAAISETGLASWLGDQLVGLQALPIIVLLLVVGALIVFVGELASNTAMAAVFLPVAGATAVAMGAPALTLALPVALFATLGFMLPVATPPNAIVFGTGKVAIGQMLRAGALLDVVGILVVVALFLSIGRWVFGAD